MPRPLPSLLADYPYTHVLPTRWNDNDVYGHVNNTVYYEYFDTVVNTFLIQEGLLEIGKSETIGLVVETGCSYFAPITFPENVTLGLRVARIGTSSVRYEIGLFTDNQNRACAQGYFVHVYVNETSRKPEPLSAHMRGILEGIKL